MGFDPPKGLDQRSLDQWARGQKVIPDVNSVTTDRIQDQAVTNPKLRNSASASVLGRAAASAGTPGDIIAGADGNVLTRRTGALLFAGLINSDIPVEVARTTYVDAGDATVTAAYIAADAAHVSAPDPHTQYLKESDAATTYQPLAAVLSMLHTGTGSPETVLAAPVGHIYLRSDGGASTVLYVKEGGGAGNTGWAAK